MKKLTEKEIIRLMKEEWNNKVYSILQEKSEKESNSKKADTDLSIEFPVAGKKELVISKGLKVKSKEDSLNPGLLYTVVHADKKEVTLEKPTGEVFSITSAQFVDEFERE